MNTCLEDISQFIKKWGCKLQLLPEYDLYFEQTFLGIIFFLLLLLLLLLFYKFVFSFTLILTLSNL